MASVIKFRIPADQVALGQTLQEVSNLRIEIDQFMDQSADLVLPFVRINIDDVERFEQTVGNDPSVESFTMVAEVNDEYLYRLQWTEDVKDVLDVLLHEDALLRGATINTSDKTWEFQLICAERNDLSTMYANCEEKGLSLVIDAIYKVDSNNGSQDGFAEEHQTALQRRR